MPAGPTRQQHSVSRLAPGVVIRMCRYTLSVVSCHRHKWCYMSQREGTYPDRYPVPARIEERPGRKQVMQLFELEDDPGAHQKRSSNELRLPCTCKERKWYSVLCHKRLMRGLRQLLSNGYLYSSAFCS